MQSIKIPNVCHSWNENQKLLLEKFFQDNMYPKGIDVAVYARKLGVSVANVKTWFHDKRCTMALKAYKNCNLWSMCWLVIYWKYVLPKWSDISFPFIISVGPSSQTKALLQQVPSHRFTRHVKEELKKAFKTCPYPTPLVKASLPKTFNFSVDKLINWFAKKREKIQTEIKIKKCKSTCMHYSEISSKCIDNYHL